LKKHCWSSNGKEKMMGNDIEEVENPVVKKKTDSKAIDSLNLAEFKHF
jgi:hypothetical protein